MRASNLDITRYRMTAAEIVDCAKQTKAFGYGTVVIQAGEDEGLTLEGVGQTVGRIKAEAGVAVTLSLGERTVDELRAWREAGADRYLCASRLPTASSSTACTRRAAGGACRAWSSCASSNRSATRSAVA